LMASAPAVGENLLWGIRFAWPPQQPTTANNTHPNANAHPAVQR
jgi:hypothetical protein